MILEDATYEAFGYYPSALKPQSHKPILSYCNLCGEFRVTSKYSYRTLCLSCVMKSKSGWNKGKTTPEEVKRKLSENHADIAGDKHPNWKGGPIERICKVCGKTFFVRRDEVKKGRGIHCSHSCSIKAHRHNTKPEKTAPEKAFEDICKKYALPFTFVGNGALWLGNANPDFVHNTKKIAVEVFGNFWHGQWLGFKDISYNRTVKGRKEQLKAEGYKCIIFWELDLMRENADKFVLRELRKEQRRRK